MDAGVVAGLLQIATQRKFSLRRIVGSEASRAKGQPPQAVAAARGRLRRRRSSPTNPDRRGTMRSPKPPGTIAFVAAPCIRRRGARNTAPHSFSAPCSRPRALEQDSRQAARAIRRGETAAARRGQHARAASITREAGLSRRRAPHSLPRLGSFFARLSALASRPAFVRRDPLDVLLSGRAARGLRSGPRRLRSPGGLGNRRDFADDGFLLRRRRLARAAFRAPCLDR